MEKEFVSYKQALALKELGFNESCSGFYFNNQIYNNIEFVNIMNVGYDSLSDENTTCLAPLTSQALRFFREKYGLWFVLECWDDGLYDFRIYNSKLKNMLRETYNYVSSDFTTYEQAEQAALDKLIEIARNANKMNKTRSVSDSDKTKGK